MGCLHHSICLQSFRNLIVKYPCINAGVKISKFTASSQSQNEALSYVENTMYFEASDLKIHFLMIRNSEITIKYPYGASYSPQHQ